MRELSLRSVTMARFRSFVRETTVDLSGLSGMRLITGSNLVDPRLGANGVGKSTIFDALCFALFGTSVRGLRASDLVSQGHQTTEASVDLLVDGQLVVVRRTSPPARVYIDGELAEQPDVDRLAGLSRARFLNSVVFGQASPLFLDLPVPARGDLLDEVLDLELWMRAAHLASTEASAASRRLNELRTELARSRGQLEGLPDLSELRRQEREWKQQHDAEIAQLAEQHRTARRELTAVLRSQRMKLNLADVEGARDIHDELDRALRGLREQRAVLVASIEDGDGDLRFFEENDECPTCGQKIGAAAHSDHIAEISAAVRDARASLDALDVKIASAAEGLPELRDAWQQAVRDNAVLQREQQLLAREARDKQTAADQLAARLDRMSEEENPYSAQRAQVSTRRRELRALLADQQVRESALLSEMSSLDYWRGGFRRARLFCLDRVLRELEVESQNAMRELGLVGWGIGFRTATETKSGTVRLGVQAEVRSRSSDKFDALSGGEAQRARLAVSLGLGSLIQRWAGVRWTLEVFDEPTQFLSAEGIEDLLDSLGERATRRQQQTWVCDHRALDSGSFAGITQVVKDEHGSRIQ